jgi:DNA-binding beta-propeller fold protein YncE
MSKGLVSTLGVLIMVFVSAFLPMRAFCGQTVKFRHITSIYADDKGVGLRQPEGVSCNEEGLLIVADTGNGRLLQFTFEDKTLGSKTIRIKVPELLYPTRVKMNSKNDIYVLDGRQRRIVRLSPQGEFEGYLEPTGMPSAASFVPRSFEIDEKDQIYVLDIFSARVLVLDPEGAYQKHLDFPENYGFLSDVTVDPKGNVLLIDSVNATVFLALKGSEKFSPLTQNLKEYVRFPTSVDTDSRGRICLVDRNGSSIVTLGQDGSFLGRQTGMGWKEGLLNYPSQLCINHKGEVFVADTNNSRIQIFEAFE